MADRMDPIRRGLEEVLPLLADPRQPPECAASLLDTATKLQALMTQRAIEKAAIAIERLADDARRELKALDDARRMERRDG